MRNTCDVTLELSLFQGRVRVLGGNDEKAVGYWICELGFRREVWAGDQIVENVAWDDILCSDREMQLVSDASVICWGSLAQRNEKTRRSVMALLDSAPEDCIKVFDRIT